MSIIAAGLAEKYGEGLGRQIVEKAKSIVAKLTLPKEITGPVIKKYIRKAITHHAWHTLPHEARALLILAKHLSKIKSPTLKEIIARILVEIELATTRGKAYFYGAVIAMKNTLHNLEELLQNTKRLLAIGIFYLNNPLIYRIYG